MQIPCKKIVDQVAGGHRMIVYMIKSDLGWYGPRGKWVTQDRARVWTNKSGVSSAKGAMGKKQAEKIQVVRFCTAQINECYRPKGLVI